MSRDAVVAALEASLELLKRPESGERFVPIPEVARRLGLVEDESDLPKAVEYVRRELRDQLPVVRLNRTTFVVREASLEAFIRRRETLARRILKSA